MEITEKEENHRPAVSVCETKRPSLVSPISLVN
jgi:hypothetical protein